jgi:hypothetical protein
MTDDEEISKLDRRKRLGTEMRAIKLEEERYRSTRHASIADEMAHASRLLRLSSIQAELKSDVER